jgi:protein gp37
MYRILLSDGKDPSKVVRNSDTAFYKPYKLPAGSMVFTCSMSDFFHEAIDPYRQEMWKIIKETPHLTYQVLTKRADRITEHLPEDWGDGYPNVWLGVSVETNEWMSRAATLASIPAKVRFLSCEPILEDIDLLQVINSERPIDKVHWVIVGGDSGYTQGPYKYRPSELAWYRRIVSDLRNHAPHVGIFIKQLGCHIAKQYHLKSYKGEDVKEFPRDLQIQEYP